MFVFAAQHDTTHKAPTSILSLDFDTAVVALRLEGEIKSVYFSNFKHTTVIFGREPNVQVFWST